jgi:hypothetical protein
VRCQGLFQISFLGAKKKTIILITKRKIHRLSSALRAGVEYATNGKSNGYVIWVSQYRSKIIQIYTLNHLASLQSVHTHSYHMCLFSQFGTNISICHHIVKLLMIIILGTQEIIILFIYISFCEFADN